MPRSAACRIIGTTNCWVMLSTPDRITLPVQHVVRMCNWEGAAHLLFSPQQRPPALRVLIVWRVSRSRREVEPRDAQSAAAALAQIQDKHRTEHHKDDRPEPAQTEDISGRWFWRLLTVAARLVVINLGNENRHMQPSRTC